MKNKDVLEKMLKNSSAPPPSNLVKPTPTFTPSSSAGRESHDRPSYPTQQPQINSNQNMGGYGHTFVPKADKFRTVPCKYYHG